MGQFLLILKGILLSEKGAMKKSLVLGFLWVVAISVEAKANVPFVLPSPFASPPQLYNFPPLSNHKSPLVLNAKELEGLSDDTNCRNNDGALVPCAHSFMDNPSVEKESPTGRLAGEPEYPSRTLQDKAVTRLISHSDVSCGNHHAESCAKCPGPYGKNWCNGQCEWSNNACVSKPGSFQKPDSFDRNAVLERVNFYRRIYNSPDAKWSKSKESLAQKATRHLCALGKLEHSGPATSCSLGYGYKSVNKMIENWCENGVDNWGSPTEAKIYCDRGYYNNPKAAQKNYWDVGHFTDVVWSDVTEVGAAIYYCPSDGRNYLAFCSNSGNVQGQWGHNVNCPRDWQGYTGSLACNTC